MRERGEHGRVSTEEPGLLELVELLRETVLVELRKLGPPFRAGWCADGARAGLVGGHFVI